ncbi:mucin-5AC [Drosophila gunungcola]|nr:mucin-5AC [Drosophila gunungcola]
MEARVSNLLPWFLVAVAVFWSWQINVLALPKVEPRHKTCDNEQRYENQVMCEDKEFGALVPYPDNCSLFLVCDCLYPTVKLCPANLWWDNQTQQCNYRQAVECIYYTIETPEPTSGTTRITQEPTTSTEKITEETSTTPSSNYSTTESTEVTTPKTTQVPTTSTEKITTESTANTEEASTTPSSNNPTSSWDPPPAPPGIPDDYCREYEDGSLHHYPYNCQAYINCTHGWPVLNYCIDDKVFNQYLLICDTPDQAECEELPLPTTTTEITPTSTTEEDVTCGPTPEGIEEDYCMPKANGFYEYPYNCSGYLACKNGCTDLDYCQPDKLFNTWLHICDTPDSVWCEVLPFPTTPGTTGKPTTPSITTTPSTEGSSTTGSSTSTTEEIITTTPGLPPDVDPNDCKGLPDGTIFAYIGNCSEYLICQHNQVELDRCPPPLLFNPDWLVCDNPDDVVCLADRTTTPIPTTKPTTTTEVNTKTTTTTTEATTLGPDQLCQGQELGASFPYTDDCSKYYLCLGNGIWSLAPCIYSSYFDPKTGECGPNVSPDACKAPQVTTTTSTTEATTTERITTPRPTTQETSTTEKTTTTSAPTTGICGGRNENENIAYPKNCNKYIVCVSPIPIAFFCPEDTFFSSKLQKCVESWEESDCEGDQSTTTPEPGYTRPPPEPTMCTNSSRHTFPYPENCQWFIRCVDDYIYMMDVCNCGEYYDPISEKCGPDVPSDACRWDYTSTTSTTSEPTTTTAVTRPPPQKGPCDDADDGALVPYPNDCSKYIKCDRPIAEAFECEEGDEFSVDLEKCVDASLANCSITTTAKSSESTTTPSEGDSSSSTTEPTTEPSTISTTESSTISSTELTTELSTESTTELSTISSTESTTKITTEIPTESTRIPTTPEPESSSTVPGTTTTDSTTAKPSQGICEGKTDDSLVPYPRNCSKFIICQYPIPVGYDCPDGLEFSPSELTCMDPELAGCSPKLTTPGLTTLAPTSPSTTESTTVTTTPQTTTTESTTVTTTPKTTTTPETTTTEFTTSSSTTEPTTVSTTPRTTTTTESTTYPSTTQPTTDSTTPKTTTVSTTPEPTSTELTTDSTTPMPTTTESTTPKTTTTDSTTVSTTTELTTTTLAPPTTFDPYTPNICCGQPLGTLLAYPNDCSRYVVCDYPIPYAVDCEEGTVFDEKLLRCAAMSNEKCLLMQF